MLSVKEVIMLNKFKKIIVFFVFSLLIIFPTSSFAWHDYANYGDENWDYHGSGRDHPYSAYIDRYYTIGYGVYAPIRPDFIDGPLVLSSLPAPPVTPILAPPL